METHACIQRYRKGRDEDAEALVKAARGLGLVSMHVSDHSKFYTNRVTILIKHQTIFMYFSFTGTL